MKKKFLLFILAFAMILPCAVFLSACGGNKNKPKEVGISVYIDGTLVDNDNNEINIVYGQYENAIDVINNKVSVKLNFDNNTNKDLSFGSDGFSILGLPDILNANEQGYVLKLSYKNYNKALNLVVHKADIEFTNVGWSYDDSDPFTYDGQRKTVSIENLPKEVTVKNYTGTFSATDAGTYTAGVEFEYDKNNYNIINDEHLALTQQWTINKKQVNKPSKVSGRLFYNGQEQTGVNYKAEDKDVLFTVSGNATATNADEYSVTFALINTTNYEWNDKSTNNVVIDWKIEKAQNTISGELAFEGITFGETLGEPSGVSALYGEITYKYYNSEYTEISKPTNVTNVGTYYVKGFSVGNDNWVAQETEYKQFDISRNYISDPKLVRNSFIYTGTAFTPELVEEINESIVEMTGDLSGTETGNYTITFKLKDKTNYGWQSAVGTAQETADIKLNWSIINSPLTMTLNDKALSASEFEARTQVNIGDKWQVSVSEGYNYSLDYEHLNEKSNKVWSNGTNEGLNGNLTVNPSHFTYVIKITQNEEVVYTKTITVNHDIFENVMVGEVAMTFDEFVANYF